MKTTAKADHTTLIELQYLPPVQYFAKLIGQTSVLLEGHENYAKGSYRNRCHIATVNGEQRLTVSLRKGKNQQQPISEVQISYDQHWQANHWHAIRSAYGNSPFFEHYADDFEVFYRKKKYGLLWDFNLSLLKTLLRLLRLPVELDFTTEYWPEAPAMVLDLRGCIHPKLELEDPHFRPEPYPQVFADRHGFQPNLSVLDLLFCAGPAAGDVLRRSVIMPKIL